MKIPPQPSRRPPLNPVYVPDAGPIVELVDELPIDPSVERVEAINYARPGTDDGQPSQPDRT